MDVSGVDLSGIVLATKSSQCLAFVANLFDTKTTISIPITPDVRAVLQEIQTLAPQALPSALEPILARGTLDLSDVPSLVLLVSQLRNAHFPHVSADSLFPLLKVCVHALVDLHYVKVQGDKDQILSMLDTSLQLLQSSVAPLKTCWAGLCA
jgi:hypothetical protein